MLALRTRPQEYECCLRDQYQRHTATLHRLWALPLHQKTLLPFDGDQVGGPLIQRLDSLSPNWKEMNNNEVVK